MKTRVFISAILTLILFGCKIAMQEGGELINTPYTVVNQDGKSLWLIYRDSLANIASCFMPQKYYIREAERKHSREPLCIAVTFPLLFIYLIIFYADFKWSGYSSGSSLDKYLG